MPDRGRARRARSLRRRRRPPDGWRETLRRGRRPCCSSAPAMWAAPSCWRLRRCPLRCAGSTAGDDAFPAHIPGKRRADPDARSGGRDRPSAARRLRARHDPRPPARPRHHGRGAAARLSVCRPDRQRRRSGRGSRSASARSAFRPSASRALVCPIGLPEIRGKDPAVIAASVAAQLLQLARTRPHRNLLASAMPAHRRAP